MRGIHRRMKSKSSPCVRQVIPYPLPFPTGKPTRVRRREPNVPNVVLRREPNVPNVVLRREPNVPNVVLRACRCRHKRTACVRWVPYVRRVQPVSQRGAAHCRSPLRAGWCDSRRGQGDDVCPRLIPTFLPLPASDNPHNAALLPTAQPACTDDFGLHFQQALLLFGRGASRRRVAPGRATNY